MTGHFEKGIWIEDAKPPAEPMIVRVKVEVDDTRVRALQALLIEMQPLLDRIERVTV
jgi:hypothetical protein